MIWNSGTSSVTSGKVETAMIADRMRPRNLRFSRASA